MKYVVWSLLVALSFFLCLSSCPNLRQNVVVAFLDGADRQAETLDQRREIKKALADMLDLPADQLRSHRYANYQMEQNTWTAPELLYAYFLPPKPMKLDPEAFYQDIVEPRAKVVIQKKLREVEEAINNERNRQGVTSAQ